MVQAQEKDRQAAAEDAILGVACFRLALLSAQAGALAAVLQSCAQRGERLELVVLPPDLAGRERDLADAAGVPSLVLEPGQSSALLALQLERVQPHRVLLAGWPEGPALEAVLSRWQVVEAGPSLLAPPDGALPVGEEHPDSIRKALS